MRRLASRIGPALALLLADAGAHAMSGETMAALVRRLDDADPRAQREALDELAIAEGADRDVVMSLVASKARSAIGGAQALLLAARMSNLDRSSGSFPARREDVRFSDDSVTRTIVVHAIGELGAGNAAPIDLALLDLRDERPRVRLAAAYLCRCAIESPAACLVDLQALHASVQPRMGDRRLVSAGSALDRQALAAEPGALPRRDVARVRRAVDAWLETEHDPSLGDVVGFLRSAPPDAAIALVRGGGANGLRWGVAALRADGRTDEVALQAVLSQPSLHLAEVTDWIATQPTDRLVARLGDAADPVEPLVEAIARRGEAALPDLLRALELDDAKARLRATWAISLIEPRRPDVLARALVPIYAKTPRGDDLESLLIELGAPASEPLADAMRSLATDAQRIALAERLQYFEQAGDEALGIALHAPSPEVALAAMESMRRDDEPADAWIPDVVRHLAIPSTLEGVVEKFFLRRFGDVYPDVRCPKPRALQLEESACDALGDVGASAALALLPMLDPATPTSQRASALLAFHACVSVEDVAPPQRAAIMEALLVAAADRDPDVRVAAFLGLGDDLADDLGIGAGRRVGVLIEGARDADPRVRRAAGEALLTLVHREPSFRAPSAEVLVSALRSPDAVVAAAAAELLARDPAAVDPLARALSSSDPLPTEAPWPRDDDEYRLVNPRVAAARALARHVPDPRAVAALEALFRAEDVGTRRAGAMSLGALDEWPDRMPLVEAALRDADPEVRASVVGAWTGAGVPCERQLALLLASAHDQAPSVREAAAWMLGYDVPCVLAGNSSVRSALVELARDEHPAVARAAGEVLGHRIPAPGQDDWLALAHGKLCGLADRDFRLGWGPLPAIDASLATRELLDRLAAMRCGQEGGEMLDDLFEHLVPFAPLEQIRALEAVASGRPGETTAPALIHLARTCRTPMARRAAVEALDVASLERIAAAGPSDARLWAALKLPPEAREPAAKSLLWLLGEGELDAPLREEARRGVAWLGRCFFSAPCFDFTPHLPEGPPAVRQRAEAELARAIACPP